MLALCGPEGSHAETGDALVETPAVSTAATDSPVLSATRGADEAGHAAPDTHTLVIDTEQSTVRFRIGLLFLLETGGHFDHVEGRIERSADGVIVHARIPVASATMDSGRWEKMLKGPRFLDGERHPWIEFRSDRLDPTRLAAGETVPGEVCLRGICRREGFLLRLLSCEEATPDRVEGCRLQADGTLLRSAYGMRSHRGALQNKIELGLELVAVAASE